MSVGRFEVAHDLYAILGVSKSAGEREIRAAHRRLVFASHPDRSKAPAIELSLVNVAASVLLDPDERRRYDELRAGAGVKLEVAPAPSAPHRYVPFRVRTGAERFGTTLVPSSSGGERELMRLFYWAVIATVALACVSESVRPPRKLPPPGGQPTVAQVLAEMHRHKQ